MTIFQRIWRVIVGDKDRQKVLHGALWMLGGLGIRFVFQFISFLVLARVLGAKSYGEYAGAIGLVIALSPFALWGSGHILVQEVARNKDRFSQFWSHAIATSLLSGTLLLLLTLGIGNLLLPAKVPLWIIAFLAFGEYFGNRVAELSGRAFQAFQQLNITSRIFLSIAMFRFLAVISFAFLPIAKNSLAWSLFYCMAGVSAGLVGMILVYKHLHPQTWIAKPLWYKFKEGFYFSIGLASKGSFSDIDKSLLLKFSGPAITGVYSVAYRILGIAFIPLQALFQSTYPVFFREGGKGLSYAQKYAAKWIPIVVSLSVFLAGGAAIGTPFLIKLIGKEYGPVYQVLLWFTPLILLKALHMIGGDVLTGSGYQGLRSAFQVIIAGINIGLNLLLIPMFGWRGAIVSALVSNGLLALLLWGSIQFLLLKQLRANQKQHYL